MNAPTNLIVESGPTITRITINRPKALNALDRMTLEELSATLDGLAASTRVVVLTGAGDKAFVAGADIRSMAELAPRDAEVFAALGHSIGDRIASLDAMVIAQVNGFALGGGCELALAADFTIASDTARFGQPEVGLGVTPGFGGTTRLVRRVGLARALQLLATGEHVDAKRALEWGLVNEVVPASELRNRVDAIAAKICENAPIAVAYAKRSARAAAETDLATANAYERALFSLCFSTRDQREGMTAFMEKRKPAWGVQ